MSNIVKVFQTTAYEVDWERLASEVEKRVMDKMREALVHWKEDLSMRQMFVQDAADGLAVCEVMLDKRSWGPVEDRLWDMDTAARDCIYDFIEEVAGADFFDIVRV